MDIAIELLEIEGELRKLAYDPASEWRDRSKVLGLSLVDYRNSCRRLNVLVHEMFNRNLSEIRSDDVDLVGINELYLRRLVKEIRYSRDILDRIVTEVEREIVEKSRRGEEEPAGLENAHGLFRRLINPILKRRYSHSG